MCPAKTRPGAKDEGQSHVGSKQCCRPSIAKRTYLDDCILGHIHEHAGEMAVLLSQVIWLTSQYGMKAVLDIQIALKPTWRKSLEILPGKAKGRASEVPCPLQEMGRHFGHLGHR